MQSVKNNGLIKEVKREREHAIIKPYCTAKMERFLQQQKNTQKMLQILHIFCSAKED